MTWCDEFSLFYGNEFRFEYLQAFPTISTSRPRLWMHVCARVQTFLQKDELWMIQMEAFLSPVHLNVGPSAKSKGLDSTLGVVPIHRLSASLPKQHVLSEELHKEVNVSRRDF